MVSEEWKLEGDTRMTDAQRRMLNAACGDLGAQLPWHGGIRLSKDDYRHMIAGSVLGWRTMPGIVDEHGQRGWIMLGGSSLSLSKTQATMAITVALNIGDDPEEQGLQHDRVQW